MKIIKYITILTLAILTNISFGQKSSINTAKSSIKWIGKKVTGQHEGYINIKSGNIELENEKIKSGNFSIDMNSVTCTDLEDEGSSQKLIGHLKSDDFFGVQKYPLANLVITSATKFVSNKATITGNLTIKGKTQAISFEVEKNQQKFSCNLAIDRSKFNIRYGSSSFFDSLGDKVIYDIFNLEIELITN
tara:strand:- start:81 stop:650 length:570 start_codon:yes stop_codon:yes gene_type:complete